jgi:uncharacterized protein (TIGR02594 family)
LATDQIEIFAEFFIQTAFVEGQAELLSSHRNENRKGASMIKNSVGRAGRNIPTDTRIVQQLLNKVDIPEAQVLVVDGNMGVMTINKIQAFQRTIGLVGLSGLIEPGSKTMLELMKLSETPDTVSNKLDLAKPEKSNTELGAPWIDTAQAEVGEKEIPGAKANPRIMEYHSAAGYWAKDDTGEKNAWCGSFVSWVMKKHGYTPPANAFRAKEWKTFGQALKKPSYGAIGIKTRHGGGHVAFVLGQSRDGKYYYMLGGNQGDTVNISRYPAGAWDSFVFPQGVVPAEALPVYQGTATEAGTEA